MGSNRNSLLGFVVYAILVISCGNAVEKDASPGATRNHEEVEVDQKSLTSTNGDPVSTETADTDGKFRGVHLTPNGCTGTVIGPYAVLTAAHGWCSDDAGDISWPGGSTTLSASDNVTHPNSRYSHVPNDPYQHGAGHHHDMALTYVPGLTPDWINEHLRGDAPLVETVFPTEGRVPMINARDGIDEQHAVGVGGSGSNNNNHSDREYDESRYNSDYSGGPTADKYQFQTAWTDADSGDSGGPAFGAETLQTDWTAWFDKIRFNRHVIGVHKSSAQDVPLAKNVFQQSGSVMQLSQRNKDAIRVNQQWIRAVGADADLDGIPFDCDTDPANPSGSRKSHCPPPLGTTDIHKPRGSLKCEPGYAVTGIKGSGGWYIDKLAVRCTPIPCLRLHNSGSSCPEQYWTDAYGALNGGGSSFTKTCNTGSVVTDVDARHVSGDELNEVNLICHGYNQLVDSGNWSEHQSLGAVGNDFGSLNNGNSYYGYCQSRTVVTGFEARSDVQSDPPMNWLTGLQPMCSLAEDAETEFHGDDAGWVEKVACPKDMIGVGTVSAPASNNSQDLGLLGLLCMDKDDVKNGHSPDNSDLLVAHGSYYVNGKVYPETTEDFGNYEQRDGLGSALEVTKCNAGYSVSAIRLDTESSNADKLSYLNYVKCTNDSGTDSNYYFPGTGGVGDNPKTLACPSGKRAYAFHLASGWNSDGASVVCRPKN